MSCINLPSSTSVSIVPARDEKWDRRLRLGVVPEVMKPSARLETNRDRLTTFIVFRSHQQNFMLVVLEDQRSMRWSIWLRWWAGVVVGFVMTDDAWIS